MFGIGNVNNEDRQCPEGSNRIPTAEPHFLVFRATYPPEREPMGNTRRRRQRVGIAPPGETAFQERIEGAGFLDNARNSYRRTPRSPSNFSTKNAPRELVTSPPVIGDTAFVAGNEAAVSARARSKGPRKALEKAQ